MKPLQTLALASLSTLATGCATFRPQPLAPEPPPPKVWPAECLETPAPIPLPQVAANRPADSASEVIKLRWYTKVQDAYIEELRAWGLTASEKLGACSAAHREAPK